MVELLREDGIETVVPLWREDAGNQGLHDAVERLFQEAGGTVTAGASYAPGTTDFTAPARRRSDRRSRPRSPRSGAATVAVYFAAFEESAAAIFAAASADPVVLSGALVRRGWNRAELAGRWPIPTPPPSPRRRSSGRRPTVWTTS